MKTNDHPETTPATLVALRGEPDAVRMITDRLKVKEMGPADHIRTKHEVKEFVETKGDEKAAESLLGRARERVANNLKENQALRVSQERGQRI